LGYITLEGFIKVLKSNDLQYDKKQLSEFFKESIPNNKLDFELLRKTMANLAF